MRDVFTVSKNHLFLEENGGLYLRIWSGSKIVVVLRVVKIFKKCVDIFKK